MSLYWRSFPCADTGFLRISDDLAQKRKYSHNSTNKLKRQNFRSMINKKAEGRVCGDKTLLSVRFLIIRKKRE